VKETLDGGDGDKGGEGGEGGEGGVAATSRISMHLTMRYPAFIASNRLLALSIAI